MVAILLSTTLSAALLLHPPGISVRPEVRPGPDPATNGTLASAQRFNLSEYRFLDRFRTALLLENETLSRLEKNGFVVVPGGNASFINFVRAYKYYYVQDLPVFITTDTILNVFHLLLEKVLETYEQEFLGPAIQKTVIELYDASIRLLSNDTVDKNISRDIVVYFAVPNLIFNSSFSPPCELRPQIDGILGKINSSTDIESFPGQDYTQYKVRGHYTKTEYLGKYFRAMMWLQRSLFDLESSDAVMKVWTISHILETSETAKAEWEKVDTVLSFLVGAPDAMTYHDVNRALRTLFGTTGLSNLNGDNARLLIGELQSGNYSHSRIISYCAGSEMSDSPILYSTWSLMGQRYVLDADIMQNVIADFVPEHDLRNRYLPSGLDIAAALGSDRACELLGPELELYNYSARLNAQRARVDDLAPDFWNLSAYNLLLDSYRPLLANDSTAAPQEWMRSSEWRTEKVNTVLGAYAELKYDTILYSAQPYGGGCSYPEGYVEPCPEFYERMARLCGRMETMFGQAPIPVAEWISYTVHSSEAWQGIRFHPTFRNLRGICLMLANISRTEMSGKDLTSEQAGFIQDIVDVTRGRATSGCPPPVGWLTDLLRANHIDEYGTDSRIVADICTNARITVRKVKEIGVGDVQTLVALVTAPNGTKFVAAGPVYSYYEFERPMDRRMSAEEWRAMLAAAPPPRPEWATDFLG